MKYKTPTKKTPLKLNASVCDLKQMAILKLQSPSELKNHKDTTFANDKVDEIDGFVTPDSTLKRDRKRRSSNVQDPKQKRLKKESKQKRVNKGNKKTKDEDPKKIEIEEKTWCTIS
jgi:hypothetical protein